MAEILQNGHRQKAGVIKTKKAALRVDLTPMVDLGFLLISFFIFTTTISQPTVMKLALPDDLDLTNPSEAPDSKTLNIILADSNKVYTYTGFHLDMIKSTDNRSGIRDAIIQKKKEIKKYYGSDTGMIVLIKPTPASTYENILNALDEMLINNIKTYMLMDAGDDELKAIKK